MRIDIGIIVDETLTVAIECKRNGQKMSPYCRQARAYKALRDSFGIQIYFLNDLDEIDGLVKKIKGYGSLFLSHQ